MHMNLKNCRCCVLSSQYKKNSVKWFKMFDKLITKLSNEGIPSFPFPCRDYSLEANPQHWPLSVIEATLAKESFLQTDQTLKGPLKRTLGALLLLLHRLLKDTSLRERGLFLVSRTLFPVQYSPIELLQGLKFGF